MKMLISKYIIPYCILAVIILTITSGCDERSGQKPTMDVIVQNNHLYPEASNCNLDYTEVQFLLEGTPGFINDINILLEYDKDKGNFIGGGHSDYVTTNNNGQATGTYLAKPTAVGSTNITARMDNFRNVEASFPIYFHDLPVITITADRDSVAIGDNLNLSIQLSSQSGNITGHTILFSTTGGNLSHPQRTTDELGRTTNVYDPDNQTGEVTIRATWQKCLNVFDEITIKRYEPENDN